MVFVVAAPAVVVAAAVILVVVVVVAAVVVVVGQLYNTVHSTGKAGGPKKEKFPHWSRMAHWSVVLSSTASGFWVTCRCPSCVIN